MARVNLAAGLLFLSVVIASAHPPHAAGASFKQSNIDSDPWRRLGEDAELDSVPDDWSAGFGRRVQRRQGATLLQQQQQPPPPPEQPAEQQEASTKLVSVTQQLKSKAEVSGSTPAAGVKAEASTIRLIRKRLPENRTSSTNKNATEDSVANATLVNETVQPNTEVTKVSLTLTAPIESNSTEPAKKTTSSTADGIQTFSSTVEEPQPSSTTSSTTTTSTTTTTTTTTTAPLTSSVIPATTTLPSSNKPAWRIRMEQNQNIRRGLSTVKPADSSEVTTSSAEVRNSTATSVVVSPTSAPSVESSQSDVFTSSVIFPTAATSSSSSSAITTRPIQSSRIASANPSLLWTPIVRLPAIGSRNIPSGTLRIQITSSRLPSSTTESNRLLESAVEENDVKHSQTPSTPRTTTTTTSTTTTTTEATTRSSSTTRKASAPTPVMHSLEDILQRLVPAKDESFGGNPFLVAPVAYYPAVPDDTNEIVSIGEVRSGDAPKKTVNADNHSGRNSSSANSGRTDSSEAQTTTSIYVVGVVAVIPLTGLILWVVRVQLHKRRERLNESETSSETGFRKRLPPVALTPSKHARLFYGGNDKEDLVSGSASPGGNSGGKSSPPPSPWEFTRSRLRLQTLIGEGNFGQVWKAEAEDICDCQGTLLVAVKTVKDGASNKEKQELLREMRIMQQLGPHPNVVALLGCCTEQEPFLLIMEYVMYGRLLTFLRDHRTHQTYYNYSTDSEALTSRDLTTFAYCVAKGMEYIYSKGVVHRDLAARNVLVDHNKLCKVADFGLSRSVRDTAGEMYEQRVKGALPIRWMAPESLIQSVFTQKSDVWSFGILVWEIVTLGSTPYPGMEARDVMRRVKDGHRLERPNHCRPEFYRLMSRCWHSDPQRRPDFGELKSELGQLLDDADGYIDLDNFQESIYVPLESPSDESEKV